ncbi:MAG: hypothetical protein ACR2N5_01400, partial [Solirubrobacterales bacterium]
MTEPEAAFGEDVNAVGGDAGGPPAPPREFASGREQDRGTLGGAPLRGEPRPSRLDASLRSLKGIGPKLSQAAAEMGLTSLSDLLAHVPRDYREPGDVGLVQDLKLGDEATLLLEIRSVRVRPTRRRGLRIVEADAGDSSGPVKALWFNQAWLAERLGEGTFVLARGKLDRGGFRVSEHEIVDGPSGGSGGSGGEDEAAAGAEMDADAGPARTPWAERPVEPASGIHTTGLVPVHPASERLRAARIREWAWRGVASVPD